MNIRDLEYLVALSEHQHFRKAAEACFVSQPTLSGQIRKLEDELGVMLLERSSRKVFFTEAGMNLVRQAQKVLREVKVLEEMACTQANDMSGVLNMGMIPTIGPYLLPHIIPVLKSAFPQLGLHIFEAQTSQLAQQLDDGKLDCVIWAAVKETEPFKELKLYLEPFLFALPEQHPWATLPQISMSRLEEQSLLLLSDGHCLRDQALDYCFSAGANEDSRFRATSLETLRSMVASDVGVTLLPKLAVPSSQCRDGVVYVNATDPEPRRLITLGYRPSSPLRNRYEKLAKTIADVMKQHCYSA